MKSHISNCKFAIVMTLAGLLYLMEAADEVNPFKRCYNTSVDTHCFDAQYDTTNKRWLTASFDIARKRCRDLSSTLLIIKDEETNDILRQYFNESSNPIRYQFVWTDAYRITDLNNTRTWHWINSSLPTVKESDGPYMYAYDYKYYVAVLEFRGNSFHLTAKAPNQMFYYICEYTAESNYCTTSSSNNVRQFNGRCYVATSVNVSWYEARNRCLKYGGDLASFANVTNNNFTSWLDSVPYTAYFIGLQFTWYIWIGTGETVKYSNWKIDGYFENTSALVVTYDNPNFSWFPKENTTTNVSVVCHTITPINPTTISTTTTTTTISLSSSESSQNGSRNEATNSLAIAVGVGVGVGVPLLIAGIVFVICIVVRKSRRQKTPSSTQSTNHQQKEKSVDQLSKSPTDNGRSEEGGPTYGTVVPSTIAKQKAEKNGANTTSENADYAPLQFL